MNPGAQTPQSLTVEVVHGHHHGQLLAGGAAEELANGKTLARGEVFDVPVLATESGNWTMCVPMAVFRRGRGRQRFSQKLNRLPTASISGAGSRREY